MPSPTCFDSVTRLAGNKDQMRQCRSQRPADGRRGFHVTALSGDDPVPEERLEPFSGAGPAIARVGKPARGIVADANAEAGELQGVLTRAPAEHLDWSAQIPLLAFRAPGGGPGVRVTLEQVRPWPDEGIERRNSTG